MGKIIACMPIVIGNGCKYTTINLAHYKKSLNQDDKVLLIDFDLENPYLGEKLSLSDKVHTIDNLVEKINADLMNESVFNENLVKLKNEVMLLKGTRAKRISSIKENHINEILEIAKNNFDYIFVSLSNKNSSAVSSTLFHADEVVLVSKNNYSNLNKFDSVVKIINHYKKEDTKINLVVNHFTNMSDVSFAKYLESEKIENTAMILYNEQTIDNLDLDKSMIVSGMTKMFLQSNKKKSLNDFEVFLEKMFK
ncbi:MAG: AAA family ATPase [Peptostreptococcaceae bacterium]